MSFNKSKPWLFHSDLIYEGPKNSPEDLDSIQSRFKQRIPEEVREFILRLAGKKVINPNYLAKSGEDYPVREFFTLEKIYPYDDVPWLLDFGDSIFGDHYGISLRIRDKGSVYFIDHELADPDQIRLLFPNWITSLEKVRGFTKIADSISEYEQGFHFDIEELVRYRTSQSRDLDWLKSIVEERGGNLKNCIGTPLIDILANHSSLEAVKWLYEKGERSDEIVPHAVQNSECAAELVRYLLERGESAAHTYSDPEKGPYAVRYALTHNLIDVLGVLIEFGYSESDVEEFEVCIDRWNA